MRSLAASILALCLTASAGMAGENGLLPPGRPAGLAQAQGHISTFYVVSTGLVLVAGVAFLISTDHSATATVILGGNNGTLLQGIDSPTTTTTTTTT
jgi:hypothetical protein